MASPLITFSGPPGCGKSAALVREALRLVSEEGLPPGSILLLAMTGHGKQRLESLLEAQCEATGIAHRNFSVQTFETFCKEILRRYSSELRPDFRLLSETQTRIILQRIGTNLAEGSPPNAPYHYSSGRYSFACTLSDLIARLRLSGITTVDLAELPSPRGQLLTNFVRRFESQTQQAGLLTYPELLQQVAQLLALPEALAAIQQDLRALLIDDAQELGQAHFHILRPLLPETRLALSGTEHFSIRGFPGSDPGFSNLSRVFPDIPVTSGMAAEQLSSVDREPAILWLASAWQQEYDLPPFWEARPPEAQSDLPYFEQLKEHVRFGMFPDFRTEAMAIARKIRQIHEENERPWQDFAVLLRRTRPEILDALHGAFSEAGIPVDIQGMPESAFQLQALIFHGLKVFEQLELLQSDTLTVINHSEAVLCLNRHLYEWLAYLPELDTIRDLMANLEDPESRVPATEILEHYRRGHPQDSAIDAFLSFLETAQDRYQRTHSLYTLCWAILQHSPHLTQLSQNPTGKEPAQILGDFLRSLKEQEENVFQATGIPLELCGFENWFTDLWQAQGNTGDAGSQVQVRPIFQCQGRQFPIVFLPALVSGNFPVATPDGYFFPPEDARLLESRLSQQGLDPDKTRLPLSQEHRKTLLAKEATLMTLAMTRTGESLFLSSHRNAENNENLEAIQPSPFFRELLTRWQSACEEPDWLSRFENDEAPWSGWTNDSHSATQPLPDAFAEERDYHGHSLWSRLPQQTESQLYDDEEELVLNPTGLGTYMQCPRQYYYRHILRLKTPQSAGASAGTAVHTLMETFNRQFPEQPYTCERLKALAEAFFNQDSSQFHPNDLLFLQSLDPVAFHDLRNRVMASLEDLNTQGYFSQTIQSVLPEEDFHFTDADLPGVQWRGRMDALLQSEDGLWDIVDYKTGKPAKDLLDVFEPFVHTAETPEEKFGSKPRHYQIPLYYLATQQDKRFKGKVRNTGLRFIRPPGKDGSFWISISSEAIEERLPAMKADLLQGVIQPLREAQTLSPNPGTDGQNCARCDFFDLCDASEREPDE